MLNQELIDKMRSDCKTKEQKAFIEAIIAEAMKAEQESENERVIRLKGTYRNYWTNIISDNATKFYRNYSQMDDTQRTKFEKKLNLLKEECLKAAKGLLKFVISDAVVYLEQSTPGLANEISIIYEREEKLLFSNIDKCLYDGYDLTENLTVHMDNVRNEVINCILEHHAGIATVCYNTTIDDADPYSGMILATA